MASQQLKSYQKGEMQNKDAMGLLATADKII